MIFLETEALKALARQLEINNKQILEIARKIEEMQPDNKLMNISAACKFLSVSPSTLRSKLKEIPHLKNLGRILIQKSDLIIFINQNKIS